MNDTELLRLMLGVFMVVKSDDGIEHLAYQGSDGSITVGDIYPEQEKALIKRKREIAWPEEIEIPRGFGFAAGERFGQ